MVVVEVTVVFGSTVVIVVVTGDGVAISRQSQALVIPESP